MVVDGEHLPSRAGGPEGFELGVERRVRDGEVGVDAQGEAGDPVIPAVRR